MYMVSGFRMYFHPRQSDALVQVSQPPENPHLPWDWPRIRVGFRLLTVLHHCKFTIT